MLQSAPQKERLMTTIPVLDDLERCKIALQYVAERQSDSLTVVLELLVERLDTLIGEVDTQLRQDRCAGHCQQHAPSGPAPRGVLTLMPSARQTPHAPASVGPEEVHAEEESPGLDA
jgi:hypothetical protein